MYTWGLIYCTPLSAMSACVPPVSVHPTAIKQGGLLRISIEAGNNTDTHQVNILLQRGLANCDCIGTGS